MHFDPLWLFSQLYSNCPLLTWWKLIQDPSDMVSGVLVFGMARSFRLSYISLLGAGVTHFSKWPGVSWYPTRVILKSGLGGFGPESGLPPVQSLQTWLLTAVSGSPTTHNIDLAGVRLLSVQLETRLPALLLWTAQEKLFLKSSYF